MGFRLKNNKFTKSRTKPRSEVCIGDTIQEQRKKENKAPNLATDLIFVCLFDLRHVSR